MEVRCFFYVTSFCSAMELPLRRTLVLVETLFSTVAHIVKPSKAHMKHLLFFLHGK